MESLNEVFDVFSKERRRYALYALDRADGPLEIRELAKRVHEWETDGKSVSTTGFDDVVLSLRHAHLPKAARAEYIEYDRAEKEIEISGNPTGFQILLRVSEAIEDANRTVFDPNETTPDRFLAELRSMSD